MIENIITRIIGEQLNLFVGYIIEETKLCEICEDIVDQYQIIFAIEDELNIDMSEIDTQSISTVGDLIGLIKKNFKFTNYTYPLFESKLRQKYGIVESEDSLSEVEKLHYEFAASTVSRGNFTLNNICNYIDMYNKSFLDVGCAYGGFLVAAKRNGASRIVGIDVDTSLLNLCKALLKDTDTAAEVYKRSILNFDEICSLGQFDLITCNDVIEHVEDPDIAIRNMASILRPGGIMYLQIPNRLSVNFLLSDGHFKLPGITILPKEQADQYFSRIFEGRVHDVTYKSLFYYIDHLNRQGLKCDILNPELNYSNKEEYLQELKKKFDKNNMIINQAFTFKDEEMKKLISSRSNSLYKVYEHQFTRYLDAKKENPKIANDIADKLILTFGVDFWEVMAVYATNSEE